MKILVVDDDRDILRLVSIHLQKEGYRVVQAESAEEALAILEHEAVDLVIADVMMPNMNGFELTEILTNDLDIPVILLTAKGQLADKEQGFLAGSDDYIVKPFEPRELLFRVAVIARRLHKTQQRIIRVGNVRMDREHYELTIGEKTVILPMKEFELLAQLAQRAGSVTPRSLLIEEIWGQEADSELTLNTHMNRVRDRLKKYGATLEIQTVRGIGYKLEVRQ
ncbi:response regulator transcription factor [Caryophanon latum]|uniref:Heme response regulator HssR n=1 Tax=Caryophanon latum TaxID=33977 RepID=A0A1C0YV79_9BACL|nr:response regulator transcription factor [Caryophanon latum]OCS91069.1 DNA-binding response regulator [Caryophanon latum]